MNREATKAGGNAPAPAALSIKVDAPKPAPAAPAPTPKSAPAPTEAPKVHTTLHTHSHAYTQTITCTQHRIWTKFLRVFVCLRWLDKAILPMLCPTFAKPLANLGSTRGWCGILGKRRDKSFDFVAAFQRRKLLLRPQSPLLLLLLIRRRLMSPLRLPRCTHTLSLTIFLSQRLPRWMHANLM